MGFFALVEAQTDLPFLSNVYPDGSQPFQFTNKLGFTVTSPGGTIPQSGIQVLVDGTDVSSLLTISGSDSSKDVVFPYLMPNALHTSVILVTNLNGAGIAVTNSFDTFTQDNYMVDAEDFNYDGGQHLDDAYPGAYLGLGANADIDYFHTTQDGEQFAYRVGLPTEIADDFLRNGFGADYHLGWFGNGDWANYTHNYPAGAYRVFGRFAGDGGYSMYLDQVVSDAATTNQMTERLGRWGAVGRGWQVHDWVPLTDEGLAAPITVSLDGLTTLRISTTGNCNPNYFMLVPTTGINLSATKAAGNVVLSFPTEMGVIYRVFYRDDLSTGNWIQMGTVLGDGTRKSVSEPATADRRFYAVVAP